MPRVYEICEPSEIANAIGFLQPREETALFAPHVREAAEIEGCADTYLTLHWRLRQWSLKPGRMDFVSYVSAFKWANMRLDELEVIDDELAINGVRIDKLDQRKYRETVSITRERRIALDWLLGFERLYSSVTTDT